MIKFKIIEIIAAEFIGRIWRLLYLSLLLIVTGLHPYSSQAEDMGNRYQIDKELSDIRIMVYKAGAMKFMGHNHVIRATEIDGAIYQNLHAADTGTFDMQIPLAGFVVDKPADRKRSGEAFSNKIDNEAAHGTRKNMMSKLVLDSEKYPLIIVTGQVMGDQAELEIRIKGQVKKYIVPVNVVVTDKVIKASGRLELKQTDFGIEPFSLLGGMLAVQDEIFIEFNINAESE